LQFEQKDGKVYKPFSGMMVDMNEDGGPKEGIVIDVKERDRNSYYVTVRIAGQSKEVEVKWPSDRITFCSKLIPSRECEKKSMDPVEASRLKFDVCFSQH
jgi:hypothetical protein